MDVLRLFAPLAMCLWWSNSKRRCCFANIEADCSGRLKLPCFFHKEPEVFAENKEVDLDTLHWLMGNHTGVFLNTFLTLPPLFPTFWNSRKRKLSGNKWRSETHETRATAVKAADSGPRDTIKAGEQEQSRKDRSQRSTEEPWWWMTLWIRPDGWLSRLFQPRKSGSLSKVWRRRFEDGAAD